MLCGQDVVFEGFFLVGQSVFCVRSQVPWKMKTTTIGPLDLQVRHPESTKHTLNIFGEKIPESSTEPNLNLLHIGKYLHRICIVVTTIYIAFILY